MSTQTTLPPLPNDSMLAKQWGSPSNMFIVRAKNCAVSGGMSSLLKHSQYDPDESSVTNRNSHKETNTTRTPNNYNSSKFNVKKLGSQISKVTKSTTDKLDRGLANIVLKTAAQMDKAGGDSNAPADQIRAVMNCGGVECTTETLPLTEQNANDTVWSMPLYLPRSIPSTGVELRVKIQMKSGVSTGGLANKFYTVGYASYQLNGPLVSGGTLSSNLQSSVLDLSTSQATIDLYVLNDGKYKFPAVGGMGWSMTDPAVDKCWVRGRHHTPPLHQVYALSPPVSSTERQRQLPPSELLDAGNPFDFLDEHTPAVTKPPPSGNTGSTSTPTSVLFATERTIESTVILPVATAVSKLVSSATAVSFAHAQRLRQEWKLENLLVDSPIDTLGLDSAMAQVKLGLCYFCSATASVSHPSLREGSHPLANVRVLMQTATNCFEKEIRLWPQQSSQPQQSQSSSAQNTVDVPVHTRLPDASVTNVAQPPVVTVPFFPPVIAVPTNTNTNTNPHPPSNNKRYSAGVIRLEVIFNAAHDQNAHHEQYRQQASARNQCLEGYLNLDSYLGTTAGGVQIPLHDVFSPMETRASTRPVGVLVVNIQSTVLPPRPSPSGPSASNVNGTPNNPGTNGNSSVPPIERGLLSFMGLPFSGPHTQLDNLTFFPSKIGDFGSYDHLTTLLDARASDARLFAERSQTYVRCSSSIDEQLNTLWPHERKLPNAYRPSSSKTVKICSPLPFNTHVHSMVLEELVEATPTPPPHGSSASHRTTFASRHVASFHNVTCGASADHSAKFSDGGLRRLESRRVGLVQAARESYMAMGLSAKKLLDSRGCKYIYASPSVAGGSTSGNTGGTAAAIERNVHRYRTQCLEIHRECASLSWVIAVRRSNCFSQALCIALTSYLSHVSDAARAVRNAAVWATHGYLLTYEGMLSSAGKEMGMIEDASDSIGMLHGVKIRLVVDDSHTHNNNTSTAPRACTERVAVDSTVVKWLEITWLPPNGNRRNPPAVAEQHSWPNVLITVGLDATYYGSRIPPPLQSTYISLVPVLFQMGVDIRQWSANKSANTKATIKEKKQKHFEEINYNTYAGNTNTATSNYDEEDEEEESGLPDNDRLIGLNTEAFRKLNAYAHAVRPQHIHTPTNPQTHANALFGDLPNGVHPLLQPLHQSVLRSAGNTMEHGVLDHAAKTCATLGGGSMIFCKSGKDRTAMQVTLKQTQFILKERFRLAGQPQTQTHPNTNDAPPNTNDTYTEDANEIYRQATVMRTYGTRLALCEKNVGQPKYAFNSLQAKFMPKMLKPPVGVIAGFLKGGKIFTEGAIES